MTRPFATRSSGHYHYAKSILSINKNKTMIPPSLSPESEDTLTVTSEVDLAHPDEEVAVAPGNTMVQTQKALEDPATSGTTGELKTRRNYNHKGWLLLGALVLITVTAAVTATTVLLVTKTRSNKNIADTTADASNVVPDATPGKVYWEVLSIKGDYYDDQCVIAADNARCIQSHKTSPTSMASGYGSPTCAITCQLQVVATDTTLHVEWFETHASQGPGVDGHDQLTIHGFSYAGTSGLQFGDEYTMQAGDVVSWEAQPRPSDAPPLAGWRLCLMD